MKKLSTAFKDYLLLGMSTRYANPDLYLDIFVKKLGLDGGVVQSSGALAAKHSISIFSVRRIVRLVMNDVMSSIAGDSNYSRFRLSCTNLLMMVEKKLPSSAQYIGNELNLPAEEILFVARLSNLIGLTPNIFAGSSDIITSNQKFQMHRKHLSLGRKLSSKGYFTLTEYQEAAQASFPGISRFICQSILDDNFTKIYTSEITSVEDGLGMQEYWYVSIKSKNKFIDLIQKKIVALGRCHLSTLENSSYVVPCELFEPLLLAYNLKLKNGFIKGGDNLNNSQFSPLISTMVEILKSLDAVEPKKISTKVFIDACIAEALNIKAVRVLLCRELIFGSKDKFCWINR